MIDRYSVHFIKLIVTTFHFCVYWPPLGILAPHYTDLRQEGSVAHVCVSARVKQTQETENFHPVQVDEMIVVEMKERKLHFCFKKQKYIVCLKKT